MEIDDIKLEAGILIEKSGLKHGVDFVRKKLPMGGLKGAMAFCQQIQKEFNINPQ